MCCRKHGSRTRPLSAVTGQIGGLRGEGRVTTVVVLSQANVKT